MKGMFGVKGKYSKSTSELDYVPPKKLGPRDIGRVHGYKGTKWEHSMFNYDFMEEKMNYHSKSAAFNKRKRANPVKHKETVNEIGIFTDFQKPEFCNDVLQNIKNNGCGWMKDKPMSRRNLYLDNLKGTKIPKSQSISEIDSPVGWTPIKYKYKNDGKDFLHEHFWFDGSGVQFEFGFSRLLSCLPPQKQLELDKQPAPTGYESKLNWLKMLLKMVTEEIQIIKREDALYESQESADEKGEQYEDEIIIKTVIEEEDKTVPILGRPPIDIIKEEKQEEITDIDSEETKDNDDNKCEEEIDVNKFRRRKNLSQTKQNLDAIMNAINDVSATPKGNTSNESGSNSSSSASSSTSASSASENESDNDSGNISSPRSNVSSPSFNTKRKLYKTQRNRANTTLANSTLNGIDIPMTPRTRKRILSRQDVARRRFMSQESVDSIQAMISNIEKQRSTKQ